jgi:hypothetical protein
MMNFLQILVMVLGVAVIVTTLCLTVCQLIQAIRRK